MLTTTAQPGQDTVFKYSQHLRQTVYKEEGQHILSEILRQCLLILRLKSTRMSEDKTQGSTGADANEEKRALNEVSMKSIFSCVKSDLEI